MQKGSEEDRHHAPGTSVLARNFERSKCRIDRIANPKLIRCPDLSTFFHDNTGHIVKKNLGLGEPENRLLDRMG